MATARKILGQSAPAATTETPLYIVPPATGATVSSVVVCNRGASDTTFRIYVAVAGAATANQQYLYYDEVVPAFKSFVATIGATLDATDVLRVFAGNANLSFNAFGIETT